ncbi:carboxyl transferase domain-containing protein [Saccharopolyspora sp. TS4A08]|uniref:biotin carboxylase n=1 Tax=Saccharopolyspora ipomoeae TaxID=3042027 RepID=A0ABT6PWC3_9PSEU|nr:carboxyl transferase domain-containing protein [Saccharopolyspora sp. TS4A08]MDI2032309.1 carboxyl transferase domain-containing protein [Saccharopolyspora sp. TS4A08]
MFSRVAIVNRGEAAMRLIHAVRDLSSELGRRVETVALHTDADRDATFVREADLAIPLGPASARPYLDHAVLERALVDSGADAAWVGWGFVAEDPAFAELCDRIGVTFVGPSAEAMRRLGDKIGAKLLAEEVGVPVAPWSRSEVATLDEALRVGEDIGYPLMLKATAGGGGRGIRVIHDEAELTEAYERTRLEAERAFGSGAVFLERLVTGARHVEVQVIADGQGTAWALGVRDCSVQRRNQKIIEESASPVLNAEQARELKESAERLAVAVDYRGACTVEFLYHPGERLFAFLEVNTRLQVEHPITEATTGTDLVRLQLHVAGGGPLEGARPGEVGHAVEARLNAEDPDRDFAPAPGRIARLVLPAGPGIRVDTGVGEGDTIPPDFDSMIAKIIAVGADRDQALARLRRAMAETTVVIEGGATNKSFVLDLLDRPEVIDGSADTGWIDRVRAEGDLVTHRHSAIALAAAAIDVYGDAEAEARERLLATARGGYPQVRHDAGAPLALELRGVGYRVSVSRIGAQRFRVGISGGGETQPADVEIERFDAHSGRIWVNGRGFRFVSATHGPNHLVEIDGVAHRISRDEGGVVRSPAPALVVATPLAVGDEVEAGAPVLVLESMKMETVLRAPFRARVRECPAAVGNQVETGAPLLRLEPLADDAEPTEKTAEPVEIDLPARPEADSAAQRVERGLRELRDLLLGFDADDRRGLLTDYLTARAELGARPCSGELDLLAVFADLAELARDKPRDEADPAGPHSPREHFHRYLQSLDPDRSGASAGFQAVLSGVLAHHGVTDLVRTPELEAAVFRTFLALQRMPDDVVLASELLTRFLGVPPPDESLRERAELLLERLVEAARTRFPEVADLARDVLQRWFSRQLPRLTRDPISGEHVAAGEPEQPLDDYRKKVLRAARRGTAYPYELIGLLAGADGTFVEHDLHDGALVPVERPKGGNDAGLVVGVASTPTTLHPEGVKRVVLLGDPTRSLGALAEPECARVVAAIDLAEEMGVPLEWFALSAGARISMTSGTETMDWISVVLKRIITFTQGGGEINVVVAGINVGAQPYWNAEATMLMHTKGILVMTPDSAMVLTGKQSLDFSGGVSAEDNFGIGGYDRVMGPNGQAQYWAPHLTGARDVLMAHYEHTYVAPGEAAPRSAGTSDPVDRDICDFPHEIDGSEFTRVGQIFSPEHNPDRKKPFDIRTVMRAVSDQDHEVLERWAGMADADTAVVQDAHVGGHPVCLLGIESRSVPRRGFLPTDGPDAYTAGTLFPLSSKKTARAINAASGNRPLVVLANLSGFDGSPESMRKLQLEYGAEIGRAIVNFDGPIVFCVISRYHGGAFVVFSKALNPNMTVLAVEGSYASVIGGAPAAAVVFARDVRDRTTGDPRVAKLQDQLANADDAERDALTAQLADVRSAVRAEKLGEVAAEFDRIHSIERAVEMGSVDSIISPAELRSRIIAAVERGTN